MKVLRVLPGQEKAIARQPDGRGHHPLERELAIFLFGIDHSGDRARYTNCFEAY